VRVCIVGGGLAGTLLAWRLAQTPDVRHVELLLGAQGRVDATSVSGGVVRGYEPRPAQRRLAIDSLAELRDSATLRQWSGYREVGSVYLRPSQPGLGAEVREIDARARGTVTLATDNELAKLGWAGLPAGTVGVLERLAGYVSPWRLRTALIADLTVRPRVTVSPADLETLTVLGDGAVRCSFAAGSRVYDVAVVAAGPWTPGLLARNGLGSPRLRTKAIQYTVYAVAGVRPPPFVDETTGLYGRPTGHGGLLLGLAGDEWDVPPGTRPARTHLQREAARLAANRLPALALVSALSSVNASDCYCDHPLLSLRPVAGSAGGVVTFTGGSGGSVKTALAASRRAARHLVGRRRCSAVRPLAPTPGE
jgi:glycine/D-amino acid oxidase-like deaminating enzyme